MSNQGTNKSGVKSISKKMDENPEGFNPAPSASPVDGAFGRETPEATQKEVRSEPDAGWAGGDKQAESAGK